MSWTRKKRSSMFPEAMDGIPECKCHQGPESHQEVTTNDDETEIYVLDDYAQEIFVYSNGSFGEDLLPANAELEGMGFSNNDVLVFDTASDKLFARANNEWDAGIDGPSGATEIKGMFTDSSGTLVIDKTTKKYYEKAANSNSWNSWEKLAYGI